VTRLSRAHAAGFTALPLAGALAAAQALQLAWTPGWLVTALPLAGFLAMCAAAPFFPRLGFFLPIVSHGPRSIRAVALSFDDGPDPATTPHLLALLSRHSAPAAFFVIGEKAARHPELVADICAAGHEVCNHTLRHDPLLMLRSTAVLEREIAGCQDALAAQGIRPLAFRPPVGITNPRLGPVLERLGLRCVCFSCRPTDFANRRVVGLADRVLSRVRPGDVVLLHDCLPRAGLSVEEWLREVEATLAGLYSKKLAIHPLSRLVGFSVSEPVTAIARPVPDATARRGGRGPRSELFGAMQAGLFLAYPLLVYLGLSRLSARSVGLLLAALLAPALLRSWRERREALKRTLGVHFAVAALALLAVASDDARFILAYPALVNAVLLLSFSWTLRRGSMPMVERFARLQTSDLPPAEVAYCRRVTQAWIAFFVLNGSACAAFAFASRSTWAIYTGLVSYALLGACFAVEYTIRKWRFRRYGAGPLDRLYARIFPPGDAKESKTS